MVTSALPYANGPLHIGHLAGAYLPADIFVRYLRLMGEDVVFICGSDENGAAITIRAKMEGTSPQEIVDKYDKLIGETFKKIGIHFDKYHRTSSELHHQTSQDFFRVLNKNGEFVKKTSEQYYDVEAQQFLADRYITGTCPKCNHEEAYGDQCENCGSTLSPTELINPKSKLSGATPELRSTTHWYLPMDKYEEWLRPWIEDGTLNGEKHHEPNTWKSHVLGQCKSWLDGGLQARAMTRDLSWGVDVPQELEGSEGKKLYVWLDAPIGYISATKQWAIEQGEPDAWKKYWQDENSELVHFIGKDNIVFHCVIFPIILKAHGDYILPKNVPANQFMNLEGRKISTSNNWAIWVHEFVEDLPGMEDVLRYYMIKNMPEQKDSEFTWKSFQEANDSELVGNIANFINRVITLTNKYYDGIVPEIDINLAINNSIEENKPGNYSEEIELMLKHLDKIDQFIKGYDFRNALKEVMAISDLGNRLLQFNEPWKKIKTEPETVKTVLHLGLQIVGLLSGVSKPFLPFTSDKIQGLLNLPSLAENGGLASIKKSLMNGDSIVPSGHRINKQQHLFSRIPDKVIDAQIEKLNATLVSEPTYDPVKETATFDDFTKMDFRTGTIIEAEKIKKAKKLLKLTVDLGFETRTVVSGIAEFYTPEEVLGKEVVLLANLAPRKLRGVESQGMVLMAEDAQGKLGFVSPESGFGNGFTVR